MELKNLAFHKLINISILSLTILKSLLNGHSLLSQLITLRKVTDVAFAGRAAFTIELIMA